MTTDSEKVVSLLLDESSITALALVGKPVGAHQDFCQHMLTVGLSSSTTGTLQVRAEPLAGKILTIINSDLDAVDLSGGNQTFFFQGYYRTLTFQLTTGLGATRDLQAILTSSNNIQF